MIMAGCHEDFERLSEGGGLVPGEEASWIRAYQAPTLGPGRRRLGGGYAYAVSSILLSLEAENSTCRCQGRCSGD